MLQAIAPDIWHIQHAFVVNGIHTSSRMTVVRFKNGALWLHSPIPLSAETREQLEELGEVRYIVAPSKTHHLFAAACQAAFPSARLFGAPGLSAKRPDLQHMTTLTPAVPPEWQDDLEQVFFAGIPFANETDWYHKPSRTLILTDICQWWRGDMPFAAKIIAQLVGVRAELTVPRHVRLIVKDKQAARTSARKILEWPFERVLVAHNAIIEVDAHAAVAKAFACFDK